MSLETANMLGLGLFVYFLYSLGKHFSTYDFNIDKVSTTRIEFFRITGVLFYFFSFFVLNILVFVLMEMNVSSSYHSVLRSLFIVTFVLLGLISGAGLMVTGIVAAWFGFIALFTRKGREVKRS